MEKHKTGMERHKLEAERQVAIERETEQKKIALQTAKLGLVREGKLSGEESSSSRSPGVSNLRLA